MTTLNAPVLLAKLCSKRMGITFCTAVTGFNSLAPHTRGDTIQLSDFYQPTSNKPHVTFLSNLIAQEIFNLAQI